MSSQTPQLHQLSNVFEIIARYSILCTEDNYIQKQNIAQLSKYEKPRQKRSQSLLDQVLEKKSELLSNFQKRKSFMQKKRNII
ncbi:unnamed protein product (macronuclear) [Paramecium tetraurelia]|uniref:Uncharacterized protein n=1 Tax=Paramecium tetraurelia TaxID=5888 RepID=A0E7Y8_PARTE|nr:uncharacterized protein GSPATT00024133001 [Paramecium tetraurelia]CAK91405.1 unnamed protein product [Paramecium tetraurelia]|eukprot:XP_001458802.1 hypothetical protein (macronuclear) [Paramecium tetraurelia strain d4-2]